MRDGGPVLSDKGRDTMNILRNAEFPDDWLLGLRQVVRDPALYELLKYCPLEIMQCWRFDNIPRQHSYLPARGKYVSNFRSSWPVK
ncbi:cyclic nucleotide-binding domain-containing protein [Salmonella bongori]|nr:cyclic nucleotide-binding domain-containing protein [Salmonella bongori]